MRKTRYVFVPKGEYINNYIGFYIAYSVVWKNTSRFQRCRMVFGFPLLFGPLLFGLIPVPINDEGK